MSSIGSSGNRVELHVQIGKTSVEELQQFHDQAAQKGGGEIRGRKNDDGSFTLYLHPQNKSSFRSYFRPESSAADRASKRELAKTLVADIVSRRLPANSQKTGDIMSKLGMKPQSQQTLTKDVLSTGGRLELTRQSPELNQALNKFLQKEFSAENLQFLDVCKAYKAEANMHKKMILAEELFTKYGSTDHEINLSDATRSKFKADLEAIRSEYNPQEPVSSSLQTKLDTLLHTAEKEISSLINRDSFPRFLNSNEFSEGLEAHNRANQATDTALGHVDLGDILSEARGSLMKSDFSAPSSKHLDVILDSPELHHGLEKYLKSEFSDENLEFLDLCKAFKAEHSILEKFNFASDLLKWSGPSGGDINISSSLRNELQRDFDALQDTYASNGVLTSEDVTKLDNLFQKAETEIRSLLIRDSLPRFIASSGFQTAVEGHNARVLQERENTLSPDTSVLRPGSGDKFLQQLDEFISKNPDHPNPRQEVINQMLLKELEINKTTKANATGWDKFEGVQLTGSGGATGSGQAKIGNLLFQVKAPASGFRYAKAGFSNAENYGEFIASSIAKGIAGNSFGDKVPTVALRLNTVSKDVMVTSQYLQGVKGDLGGVYKKEVGALPPKQKHPKIDLTPSGQTGTSGNGVFRLGATGAQDVRRNLALSALLGDHDVNPGNMIALKNGGVGRIDFGHAFNDLVHGASKSLVGGGVQYPTNRILDFFNRDKIAGNPFKPEQQIPKLWRDYIGSVPSFEMSVALREIANSTDQIDGLGLARSQFENLIAELQSDGSPEAQSALKDIVKSLKVVSAKLGADVSLDDPMEVVDATFSNLKEFIEVGQQQMNDVANLCDIQSNIMAKIAEERATNNLSDDTVLQQVHEKLMTELGPLYNNLTHPSTRSSVSTPDGSGVHWLKMSADRPAITGDLSTFISAMLKP